MGGFLDASISKDISFCNEIIKLSRKKLSTLPKGHVRFTFSHGKLRAYRTSKGNPVGTYINRKHADSIGKLVETEYCQLAISEAKKHIEFLNSIDNQVKANDWSNLRNSLGPEKLKYLDEDFLSNDEYARKWQSEFYEHREPPEDGKGYKTKQGFIVNSKTELTIANILFDKNIPCRYEPALVLTNGVMFYPDFELLDVRTRETVLLEHFGMVDLPEYRLQMNRKIFEYMQEGYVPFKSFFYTIEGAEIVFSVEYL